MLVSGFTIIKNAIINDYPVVEAIQSILPIVDEMIVLVGDCEDETLRLIESINDKKIKIHHSVWDKNLRKGGEVLAVETNKAFSLINPNANWAFYIQADEAIHEKYHAIIVDAMKKYKNDNRVEGLLFNYLHFYGTYDYVGDSRKWYNKEIRIIRNDRSIYSYRDAQGFRKDGRKLQVKLIDAFVYHYGYVKNPLQMRKKQKEVSIFWLNDEEMKRYDTFPELFDYNDFDSLVEFSDTHPTPYKKRIEQKNWNIKIDTSKKKFSTVDKLLYIIEKRFGFRLFDYKNYKII